MLLCWNVENLAFSITRQYWNCRSILAPGSCSCSFQSWELHLSPLGRAGTAHASGAWWYNKMLLLEKFVMSFAHGHQCLSRWLRGHGINWIIPALSLNWPFLPGVGTLVFWVFFSVLWPVREEKSDPLMEFASWQWNTLSDTTKPVFWIHFALLFFFFFYFWR